MTISPDGVVVGPVSTGKAKLALTIPAGAFPAPAQVTLTAPLLAGRGTAGGFGDVAVAGVSAQVQQDGRPYPGTFGKPLNMVLRSPLITPSSTVLVWNGRKFVVDSGATVGRGTATASFDTSQTFLVVSHCSGRGCRGGRTGHPGHGGRPHA